MERDPKRRIVMTQSDLDAIIADAGLREFIEYCKDRADDPYHAEAAMIAERYVALIPDPGPDDGAAGFTESKR